MKNYNNKVKFSHYLSRSGISPIFDRLVGEMGQLTYEIMMCRYTHSTIMSYSIKLRLSAVKVLLELIEVYFNEQSLNVIKAHNLDPEFISREEKSFSEEIDQLGEQFLDNLKDNYVIYSRKDFI